MDGSVGWEQAQGLGERAQTCQSGTEECWSLARDKLGPIAWHLACQWACWRLSSRRMEDDGGFCPWVVGEMKVSSANHCVIWTNHSVYLSFLALSGDNNIIGIRDVCKMPRKMPATKKCLITVVNWCWLWSEWRSSRNLKVDTAGSDPSYSGRWLCLG